MDIEVEVRQVKDMAVWNSYADAHPRATLYHCAEWQHIIQKTYGSDVYFLTCVKSPNRLAGLLPLVRIRHLFGGSSLVSMPFFDFGGILADCEEVEKALLDTAVRLGRKLRGDYIELRHVHPFSWLSPAAGRACETRMNKVRLLMELPASAEVLMSSFKSKLRSQIKRPLKDGLHSKIGGQELLEDFYEVFARNMRDLGSPVHSGKLMKNVLKSFPGNARIIMVYKEKQPVACSLVVGFKNTLENPWASSLRQYSRFSPNMLLYWTMLAYACDNGYRFFDFGRSTPGEGTYRFKKQWGAQPVPLHWQYIYLKDTAVPDVLEKSRFEKAIQYWKKLPIPVTRIIGPAIRKHIGL